jgi:iron-sulfur cluster assembly protein
MSDVQMHVSDTKPSISLSDAAQKRILTYLKTKNECKAVRLSVKKTGCSGLSYVIDYVKEPLLHDIILPLIDDVVICIDKASYPFLKGLHIDYVKQGLNHKFVYQNPNQTGQCGCGESFTVDENLS